MQPSSGSLLTKTVLLAPKRASPPSRNFVGLTLKEYFNIDPAPLPHIDEENHSDAEAEAATPSFPQVKQTRDRPRKMRHKTELEELIREDKQISHPKPTHRMVTLSVEQLPPEKSSIKLPAIHDHRAKHGHGKDQVGRQQRRQVARRMQQSGSLNLAIFLRKEGKGSIGKNVMANVRRGMRSRVTSTSFYQMNMRQRTKTEEEADPALQKSFIISRYGALKGSMGKSKEGALLKKYQNSYKLSKH